MKHQCQNCRKKWDESELREIEIKHLAERVLPGEIMPSGECPECGALCHPMNEMTPTEELFDLLTHDVFTDAFEYRDRVARIRYLVPHVKVAVESLCEYLQEAHEDELQNDHYGDSEAGCSYCDLLEEVTGVRPTWAS